MTEIEAYANIRQRNNEIRWMLSDYLDRTPDFVTRDLMQELNGDGRLQEHIAYRLLLTAALGLDQEANPQDRQLAQEWLYPGLKALHPDSYTSNPYYRNIRIPAAAIGKWEFQQERYAPYELFVYNDLLMQEDLKEIVRIGYFKEEFHFPAVLENGREWMAIKPNEIETMQPALDAIQGHVVVFGLGLGYFAYMASRKETVHRITIIERNPEIIQLFEQHILPQFEHKDKIEIIASDAFEYLTNQMQNESFDFAFMDLWHDASDGIDLYLKLKPLEALHPATSFLYWIEDSLLSGLRWQLFDSILKSVHSKAALEDALSLPALRKRAAGGIPDLSMGTRPAPTPEDPVPGT